MADHDSHDHTGIPGVSSGSVATDSIWDAAGDLAVGSGANTAAKLSIGATNGMVVSRVAGAVAWALPPGYELGSAEITSSVNITATAEASADSIISAGSITFDGSAVKLHFFAPGFSTLASNNNLLFYLYDGSSSIGLIGHITNPDEDALLRTPLNVWRRFSPSAGAHTYSIRGVVPSGTGVVLAGAGGSGNHVPAFISITKV